MSPAATDALAPPAAWTCPFCPLLCDTFSTSATSDGGLLALTGSDCPRAAAALARFAATLSAAVPSIDGRACDLPSAIAAAAGILRASRQPMFGGLGTDVAGARALYTLACQTGAISDAASGAEQQHGLRALQDRGAFTTTLAEVRGRADLMVCLGGLPSRTAPEFFARCGFGDALARRLVVVADDATLAALPPRVHGVAVEPLPLAGDMFDTVALLAALLDRRALPPPAGSAGAALATLADALQAAHYAVVVWQAALLPANGALVVEAVHRIVGSLNRSTRAAALPLGGGDGAATVNQVFAWLSGLPLRSRAGPLGLEHEPLCFDAERLLAGGDVDALLWVAGFGTEPLPPAAARALPRVVLAHPAFAPALSPGAVFIPVSTPGIGSAGHLFRTDGAVLMPLAPVSPSRPDPLPTVAQVLSQITLALRTELPA